MARFVRGKKVETPVGFATTPVQKIVESIARFVRGKKFETSVRFPKIPVQKIVETKARFVRGKKVRNNGWISNNASAKHWCSYG